MGGAAAVLGAARALAETRPPVEVHVVIAACENLISDSAMRPGDIVTASNGRTIEVTNTDAGMWRLGGRWAGRSLAATVCCCDSRAMCVERYPLSGGCEAVASVLWVSAGGHSSLGDV